MKNRIKFNSPYIWAFTTYFTEGFPYTIIRQISTLFFRDSGAKLESIGLTSLFGLPWILKFLWSPQVDRYSTKRSWLLSSQILLSMMIFLAAIFAPFNWGIPAVAILFFIGAFIAATHDTAIDGYYMEALDKKGQAQFVGYRVMAYRIAMITGTGVVATVGTAVSWMAAFVAAGLIFSIFLVYHFFYLPEVQKTEHKFQTFWDSFKHIKFLIGAISISSIVVAIRLLYQSQAYNRLKEHNAILQKIYFSHWIAIFLFLSLLLIILFRNSIKNLITKDPDSYYSKAFLTFIDRKNIGIIFGAIIFLRTGEFMLSSMVAPFFVDMGIKVHYGWITSSVGLPFSIIGAMLGGKLIKDWTLKKVLWPFLFLQNFTNVVYMGVALLLGSFLVKNTGNSNPEFIGNFNLFVVVITHAFDQFAGGLGTAVLMTFLMRICKKEFKATHYAIGTGFMSISGVFTGVAGGFLCAWFGYGWFFGISFIVSVPGMVFAGLIPKDIIEKE